MMMKNKCKIEFRCMHSELDPCVYYAESIALNGVCRYSDEDSFCRSHVARVNLICVSLNKAEEYGNNERTGYQAIKIVAGIDGLEVIR